MKLIRLKVNQPFRSLQEKFEITFHSPDLTSDTFTGLKNFHPFCFAGLNGTGKSNVLEAIANIFYHMECCALNFQPDNFRKHFDPEHSVPDAFELEYFIISDAHSPLIEDTVKIQIKKKIGKLPTMSMIKYPFEDSWSNVEIQPTFKGEKAMSKDFLPEFVIGYSSGENETLSIPFIKTKLLQFDEYTDALEKNERYENPESGLLYMDYEVSQAILLANLIFQEDEILIPLNEILGITKIKSFRLYITKHEYKFLNSDKKLEKKQLTEQLEKKIKKLKNCATSWFEDQNGISIDFFVDLATKDAVKANFDDAFDFFQTLKIFYVLNHRIVEEHMKEEVYQSKGYYTHNKIPIGSPEDHTFYFLDYYIESKKSTAPLLMRQLSDGEHQFLHTMGICLLLKKQRSLILLDEPETHFNPDWRSQFIKILKTSIESGGNNNMLKDIILTSHSPYIISDCLPDKVIVFEKNKETKNNVVCQYASELKISTFGTSINILSNKIYGKKNTIGNHAMDKIQEFRIKFNSGIENLEDFIEEINETLGDSIEKLLFIKEIHNELGKETNVL
jgi:restriction system-associated AAA family ATPase